MGALSLATQCHGRVVRDPNQKARSCFSVNVRRSGLYVIPGKPVERCGLYSFASFVRVAITARALERGTCMTDRRHPDHTQRAGVVLHQPAGAMRLDPQTVLAAMGLADLENEVIATWHSHNGQDRLQLRLCRDAIHQCARGLDTLHLSDQLSLQSQANTADLQREIGITLLMGPVPYEYPSVAELLSAMAIRRNMVLAARKTCLTFHTSAAERPTDYWLWDEDRGFVIRPDVSLIDALVKATQPDASGTKYAFSCYRASEYVIVLGIAQELEHCNPVLFQDLQALWTQRPIRSAEFHEVFLREIGSMEQPLPARYFVPGDRTWFRNPDGASSDASGFEGSWVTYLGSGLFTNFWDCRKPYTLTDKCVEIYHWRHGLYTDDDGEARIDEARIAPLIEATKQNPEELQQVLLRMCRYREPRGVYTEAGGCLDTTREFARWVHPGSTDLSLPVAHA